MYIKLRAYNNPLQKHYAYRNRCLQHCIYKLSLSNSFFVRKRLSFWQVIFLTGPVKTIFKVTSKNQFMMLYMVRAFLAANVYMELIHKVSPKLAVRLLQIQLTKYSNSKHENDLLDAIRLVEQFRLWNYYFEDIERILLAKLEISPVLSWDIAIKAFNELALWGNYAIGERILLDVRRGIKQEYPENRWDEKGLYFSAIGHQAQLHWLLECLVHFESLHLATIGNQYLKPSSKILAKKWMEVASAANLAINQNSGDNLHSYLDLETFPTRNDFQIIRRNIGKARYELSLANNSTFLNLTESEIREAEAILSRFGFKPSNTCRVVGLHVRTGSDFLRQGRNSKIEKYKSLVRKVSDHGDWVVAIGDQSQGASFRNFENNNLNFINFAVKDSHERELVHLYVWAKSKFMVGNLSGGTMPAMGFNTPILWIDIYPLRHFRPPNKLDMLIPKRVTKEFGRTIVTFDEIFDESGHFYDSENLLLLHSRGLELIETDVFDILSGVEEMYHRIESTEDLKVNIKIDDYINKLYKSVDLGYGAGWSQAFISRHSNFFCRPV